MQACRGGQVNEMVPTDDTHHGDCQLPGGGAGERKVGGKRFAECRDVHCLVLKIRDGNMSQ